jgi:uncharacterized protein (TIGR02145 family)
MKKNLLLMMLCCPMVLAAQNGVTVSNLAVDAGTVTFNVSWNKPMPVMLWSDTVWVFVDYNNNGVMERLPVTGATASAGTVTKIPDNDKGVWVAGNARTNGSFSGTVKLFTAIKDVGGACVYGSNYPPVGKYTAGDTIEFTGTPEYKVVLEKSDKSTYTATVGKGESLSIPSGEVIQSFIDKTGAPGIIKCIAPATYALSGSDVCEGANITLTLSGSESGWHYQLYKDNAPVGSEKEGTGNALTFSEASTTVGGFSYTVRTVDVSGTQCEMAVSNVLAITVNPVPTITRSGGDASQTVNRTTAIAAMTYTASDAATITLRSGSRFPTGVTGAASGSSYTISGTPTVTGTFGYSLTAAVGGCTSTAAAGTITVNAETPSGAASTQTWVVGNQTWSAPLMKKQTGCTETTNVGITNPPTVAYYRSSGLYSGSGYLYNWKCVNDYATQLCPSPWRVPTQTDFINLDKAFHGSGANRKGIDLDWITVNYISSWGGVYGGSAYGTTFGFPGTIAYYWSFMEASATSGCMMLFTTRGEVFPQHTFNKYEGMQVRCIKD